MKCLRTPILSHHLLATGSHLSHQYHPLWLGLSMSLTTRNFHYCLKSNQRQDDALAQNSCKEMINNSRTIYYEIIKRWNQQEITNELKEIKKLTENPNFWSSPNAQELICKQNILEEKLNFLLNTNSEIDNSEELLKLAVTENDMEMVVHIQQSMEELLKKLEQRELESLMIDPQDIKDCFLEIHTGAGGEDASDWSQMLLKMYLNWLKNSELSSFEAALEDISYKEVGIRSALIQVTGKYAYGYLKSEQGVHRLVRLSPFDAAHKRHTSFSAVRVYPTADSQDVNSMFHNIPEKDLKYETIRAATAGGQHANKTESGIRLTHIPTGIQVQCIASRSQHQNKDQALNQLRARLQNIEQAKKVKEMKEIAKAESESNQFAGNVIRSYVLHPYQMVKDSRAQIVLSNAEDIVEGKDAKSFDTMVKGILRNSSSSSAVFNNLNDD
ncbi:hypothetical protein C9374_006702 [Naegleria lovaniensis]|uniref:Peptide chain release factor domain-containing protein n=1 Tax=Naegleria lovaniensis TaxID=51637 RepID=A0AA88KHI1_NAELO|nr:uncharacterized protein C9374_006702 [Naegleria lovaniensis]KAG2379585.1 hypothetical protein C9374_006702 [Naegleria lovaniensis]